MGTVSERTKCCSAGGNTTRSKTLTEPERLRLRLTGSEGGCSSAAWATTLSGASRRVRRRLGHSALLPRACCVQITPCAGWVSAEGKASPPGKESSDHTWVCSLLGEGNGTPLRYSCLENPMDRGAWWAAVHGVTKSRAQPSDFTFSFHFHASEEEMATHSSVLAWRIPGTGEPGGLPSMGLHRLGHN